MEEKKTQSKKVLVIEDEHLISELYLRALNMAGYEVKVIADGLEAIKEAQNDNYDIILLDLMIPGLEGSQVLDILKDPNQTKPLKAKIIVTTNLEQREQIRDKIESKADGYLIKASYTPTELVEFLNQIK